MIGPANDYEPVTTSGVIALINLQGQIGGLEAQARTTLPPVAGQAASGRLAVAQWADLIDLLSLHGHVLGRVADAERAAALAEQLVHNAPADGLAFMARAQTRAAFHRFAEALADLDAAERLGLARVTLDAERAVIFQALGRYDEALVLCRNAVERRPDFASLSALAVLQAERGQRARAECLFDEGRRRYRGVSPFPVAQLDFRRGLMWLEQGDLPTARVWFEAALDRVPAYAPALGHLAELDAALGERKAAINRLRPLAVFSDDPEYAGVLAGLLSEAGQAQEASRWRTRAAARYDELLARHPAAFADHAAEFWLTVGGDVNKARQLARQNLAIRHTPRTCALLDRVIQASAHN
jgi:tetratricopeptide (TPR) repeat protein